MSLRDHQWNSVYRSGDQNLLVEFYTPVLKEAVKYDRAVGFFSSEILSMNLKGITNLIANNGRMRLVIGHPLEEDEFLAVQYGHDLQRLLDDLDARLDQVLEDAKSSKVNRLEILAWLIGAGKLEIKFALRRKGMYHEKIGIVTDKNEDIVVFQGSANETVYALSDGFNAESLMVFPSWKGAIFQDYGIPCLNGFEDLWHGRQKNTVTIDVPSQFYEKISDIIPKDFKPVYGVEDEKEIYEKYFEKNQNDFSPKIPSHIGGNVFSVFQHQREAIRFWMANQYKGILKLATGSGKTITSLYAATKLYEGRKKVGKKFVLVVAVPYQELAKQWVGNFRIFNMLPVKAWDNKSLWYDDLSNDILAYRMGSIDFIGIVVVNRTLEGEAFQELIKKIDGNEIMIIGDECHNHGAKKVNASLPDAYYRMGLSATPFRSDEDEFDSPFPDDSRDRILGFYKSIVAEYSLGDAIHDGVLCEYDYHIIPIHLTEMEQEIFEELSVEIAKLVIIQQSSGLFDMQRQKLTQLCGRRSRLLGSAENKLNKLDTITSDVAAKDRKHTLFYCGEGGRDIELIDDGEDERVIFRVSEILDGNGWLTSRFTSQESGTERTKIMDNFVEGHIDALVSIRVLDEGVDVPICNKAYVLASTKNPRQYVQRRGRVLRKAKGKDKAIIYDFVVLPALGSSSPAGQRLKVAELERVDDFCLLATNRLDIENEIDNLGMRDD